MSRKRIILLISGLAIGIILILLWLSYIDVNELLTRLRGIRKDLVIYASVVYLSAYFIRSWRWNLLLKQTTDVPLSRTWLYSMGGNWINYLIPIRLGEVVKAWFVKHNHGTPMILVFPSIFIDKTFDTLGIFFVLLMIPILGVELSSGMTVLLILLALVFLASLTVLILSAWRKQSVVKVLQVLFFWLPLRLRSRINVYIELFVEALNVFEHHWTRLISAVVLTALGVALDGLYFYLIFRAFNIDYPFAKVLFGYTLINLSYALPQPPAQLGSNEWMMIIIFSIGFELTRHDASAIMALAHMLTAFLMSSIGVFAIALSGKQVLKAIFRGDKLYE